MIRKRNFQNQAFQFDHPVEYKRKRQQVEKRKRVAYQMSHVFGEAFFAGSAFAPLCYFSAFPSFPQYGYQFVPLGHHLLGYSIDSQTALNIEDGHLEIASFHPIFPMEKTPKSSANMDSS